jgi:hypothetical protein
LREHEVDDVAEEINDHMGRPLRVGDRVRQVGYWHGGRLRDVTRLGTVEGFTRTRAVVRLDPTADHAAEERPLGGTILRRVTEGEPVEPQDETGD